MSGVWNLIHPPRISYRQSIKHLLSSGQELYGTVTQHGVNNKTIKVRVSYKWKFNTVKSYMGRASTFQVHDEENYCTTGDKVIIKRCAPISTNKHYYVRNIVIPQPREDFYNNPNQDALMQELQQIRSELLEKRSA